MEEKDKVLYTQYTRGRGRGRTNQNFSRGKGRGPGSNRYEEKVQTNQQNWRGQGRGRAEVKDQPMEEVADQMNVTIVANSDTLPKTAGLTRR